MTVARARRAHVASVVMSPTSAESSRRAAAMTYAREFSQRLQASSCKARTAAMLYVGCAGGGMGCVMGNPGARQIER